jgi:hypothetical protein
VPSRLRVLYDGKKGKKSPREYVFIFPGSLWRERRYGLEQTKDQYHFEPSSPTKGQEVDLVVSDDTYNRLVRQRELRRRGGP